jgi:hypothetical protein
MLYNKNTSVWVLPTDNAAKSRMKRSMCVHPRTLPYVLDLTEGCDQLFV